MTYFLHFELCSLACFIKAHKSEKTATAVPEKALSRLLQKKQQQPCQKKPCHASCRKGEKLSFKHFSYDFEHFRHFFDALEHFPLDSTILHTFGRSPTGQAVRGSLDGRYAGKAPAH